MPLEPKSLLSTAPEFFVGEHPVLMAAPTKQHE